LDMSRARQAGAAHGLRPENANQTKPNANQARANAAPARGPARGAREAVEADVERRDEHGRGAGAARAREPAAHARLRSAAPPLSGASLEVLGAGGAAEGGRVTFRGLR